MRSIKLFFKKEKHKKREYALESYKYLSENEKQELVEYRKKLLYNAKKITAKSYDKVSVSSYKSGLKSNDPNSAWHI